MADRSGAPTVISKGRHLSFHEDFYHFVLQLSWKAFVALVTLGFVATNIIFALLYMIVPGSVQNASTLGDHFFFSVETLATIGYGEMSPQNSWAHSIVTVESLVGILGTAMITGLTFVRFARPSARILFSDKMVTSLRNGVPHLVFRMANWRRNQIAEAQVSLFVLVWERTLEGDSIRKPVPLSLVRDRTPIFSLSWTAMHPIDDKSPFYGDGMEQLRKDKSEIFVSLTGLDETLMQTIIARWRYSIDDIVANSRFADVLVVRDDGVRVIDYDRFHDTLPIDADRDKEKSA